MSDFRYYSREAILALAQQSAYDISLVPRMYLAADQDFFEVSDFMSNAMAVDAVGRHLRGESKTVDAWPEVIREIWEDFDLPGHKLWLVEISTREIVPVIQPPGGTIFAEW